MSDPHTAKLHRRLAAECSVPDGMLLSGMEEGEVERNMRIIRGERNTNAGIASTTRRGQIYGP